MNVDAQILNIENIRLHQRNRGWEAQLETMSPKLYQFSDVDALIEDFVRDVDMARRGEL